MAQLEQCGGRVDLAVAESLPRKRQKQNSTGFRGVSQVRPGKFQGRASIPGQQKHVGHFNSAEEAAQAVQVAERDMRQQQPVASRAPRGTVRLPCIALSAHVCNNQYLLWQAKLEGETQAIASALAAGRWQGGTGRQRARFLIRRSACRTGPFPYDGPHPLILPRVM